MKIYDELVWRGLIKDVSSPEIEEKLNNGGLTFYIGTDPTGDSLHIGHFSSFLISKRLKDAGHNPILLVGGATGLIGDPKPDTERPMITKEQVQHNFDCLKAQAQKIFGFEVVNNYDWSKDLNFIDFLRDYGKYFNVNYMLNKDIVKRRLDLGITYTEFSYMIMQAMDFYWLHENKNCQLQVAGQDQWGNITTGGELIRRKEGLDAYGLTWPLMTKSDGKKFGKTESGNIWLDPERTSPYKFYQFWLNTTDEDAARYVKIFTILPPARIDALIAEHREAPHLRKLQKTLAKEITCLIHGEEAYNLALEASQILFGNATSETLRKIDENTFLSVFEGVPQYEIAAADLKAGISIVDFLADKTAIMSSKGEARRALKSNAIGINKEKVQGEETIIGESHLIDGKYILAQSGKKNYFLVIVK